MRAATTCAECGSPIPNGALFGQCPECLFRLAEVPPESSDSAFRSKERRFGDYILQRQLGGGGMGVVYEALQVSLNRKVALKFIRNSEIASPALVRRFTIEAEAAARLHHANIVRIHEIGDADGQPYFSMDLIEGESLRTKVATGEFRLRKRDGSKGNGRSRQTEIARLIVKTARAVHHAHERGVLHRDLKPANILVDSAGEPHLTDFGLAKILHGDSTGGSGTHLTGTGGVGGTLGYMSPEQTGTGPTTECSDVYGLGATLYEMLVGQPPFEAETPVETLRQIQEQQPKNPRSLNRMVDKDLDIICMKCLEKDPRYRYISAAALADDLDNWIDLKPIRARRAGVVRRTVQWIKRNRIGASFIGTLLLALFASLFIVNVVRTQRDAIRRGEAFLFEESIGRILEEWRNPQSSEIVVQSKYLAILAGKPLRHIDQAISVTVGMSILGDPVSFAQTRATLFYQLQSKMAESLGRPVSLGLKLFKYSDKDAEFLVHGRADFLLVEPVSFLEAQRKATGIVAIAREESPSTGMIFTRANSGITNLAQLQGKSFAFSAPFHAMTVLAKGRLLDAGLTRKNFVAVTNFIDQTSVITRTNAPPAHGRKSSWRDTVAAIVRGQYTAGVTTHRRFQFEKHKGLLLLDTFSTTPDIYAAREGLAPDIISAFREALVSLRGDMAKGSEENDWDDPFRGAKTADAGFVDEFRQAYEKAKQFDRD
jgi:serine/threonine protein kinase